MILLLYLGFLTRIRILSCVREVLLRQPLGLLFILWDIDALDLKNNRPCAVVAAGNHHAVVVRPALHDGAALQRRIDIAADGIPRLAAKFTIHQVIEIVLLRRALEQKSVTWLEERAGAGFGIGQIPLLKVRKALRFQNGYLDSCCIILPFLRSFQFFHYLRR